METQTPSRLASHPARMEHKKGGTRQLLTQLETSSISKESSEARIAPKAAGGNDQATSRHGAAGMQLSEASPRSQCTFGSFGSQGSFERTAPAASASALQAEAMWRETKARYKELAALAGNFHDHVERVKEKQADGLVRKIPDEFWQKLDCVETSNRQAAARCGIGPEDPEYERVLRLEEFLGICTMRAARLQRMCMEYFEEAEECRIRVKALQGNNGPLAATARRALKRNQLVESALEPLSMRDLGGTPSERLSQSLPHPSRTLGARLASRHAVDSARASTAPAGPLAPAAPSATAGRTRLSDVPSLLQETTSRLVDVPSLLQETTSRLVAEKPTGADSDYRGKGVSVNWSLGELRNDVGLGMSHGASSQEVGRKKPSAGEIAAIATTTPKEPFCPLPPRRGVRIHTTSSVEHTYLEEIAHLEGQLKEVQRVRRAASSATATHAVQRGNLEAFFLQCMHDFRQGTAQRQRRGAVATARGHASARGEVDRRPNSSWSARVLRESSSLSARGACSASGSAAHVGGSSASGAGAVHSARQKLQEPAATKGNGVSAVDKVFQAISESNDLHLLLYEELFPHRQAATIRAQSGRSATPTVNFVAGLGSLIEPVSEFKPPPSPRYPRRYQAVAAC